MCVYVLVFFFLKKRIHKGEGFNHSVKNCDEGNTGFGCMLPSLQCLFWEDLALISKMIPARKPPKPHILLNCAVCSPELSPIKNIWSIIKSNNGQERL